MPAKQIAELGHVLPEPGEEAAWNAALHAADRERLHALGHAGAQPRTLPSFTTTATAAITMSIVNLRLAAVAAAFALGAAPAYAIDVIKSVEVGADQVKTWNAVKDFGGLHKWHPAVEKTDVKSGGDNKVGTVRELSLKGGGTITETLTAHSTPARSLTYRIDESPLPVVGYTSTIAVKPGTTLSKSTVIWSSTFKAKDGTSDADAKKAIEGIYDAGLGNLQKQLGS